MLFRSGFSQTYRNETLIKSENKGWTYGINAGFNIGGVTPIPLISEIREMKGYNPLGLFYLEGTANKWFNNSRWGMSTGLRIEAKGMNAKANVKNYGMEIINGGEKVAGNWTGDVETTINNTYLTLPVLVDFRVNDRFTLNFGPYVSYLLKGSFTGEVSDGYQIGRAHV